MKKIIIFIAILGILTANGLALAQGNPFAQNAPDPFTGQTTRCGPQGNGHYILCEEVGGIIHREQTDFAAFLRELYILAFILAGTVAFVRIVYGGVLYSWSGVINQKQKAMDIFKNVAWGMALLMGSYIILNTINPALTILQLPNVKPGKPAVASPSGTKSLSPLEEGMVPLEKTIQLDRETQANLDITNYEIYKIEDAGGPATPAEGKRLAELYATQKDALKYIQARKDQSEAAKMLFAP